MPHRMLTAVATVLIAAGTAAAAQPRASARPWTDTKISPEKRAQLLQARMRPDEELALVHGVFPRFMKSPAIGSLVSAGFIPGVPRLGVPPLLETDASLGVANAGRPNDDATALPSGLAIAATWNPQLAYQGGAMIGKEARQKGFNVMLAGGVDLVRDPRNGRNFEYVGEDPLLAGVIAGASIRGIQSNHIVSTTKHFVLNDQETGRMVLNAVIDPAALRESDLLAFELAVEHGHPGSVMCAYNRVNGPYACEDPYTLGALKRDWGWKGWVMSDWGAVHSTRAAALAGLDQESGEQLDAQVYFGEPLKRAIATGEVPKARLDDMVRRILWGMFSTGLMDHPVHAGGLDTALDAAVSQRAAEEGLVLLKNKGDLLPLAASARHIAVIGGHADAGVMSGGGSSQVIPLGSVRLPAPKDAPTWVQGEILHPSSPLKAIRDRAGPAEVTYSDGADPAVAAEAARKADIAIVFATQWATEGQDVSLTLPEGQDALIEAVAAANPHTVVVLETGGPVLMPWLEHVGAVLEAWYPGQRGGQAIADILIGRADPSGRLPVTFPASEQQLPRPRIPGAEQAAPETLTPNRKAQPFDVPYPESADVGYRWYERTGERPLFPFGYGLSYTHFRLAGLKVSGGSTVSATFEITNTGSRSGAETAQVYAAPPGEEPRLIGWSKVALNPGETRRVTVTADRRLIARFDTKVPAWRVSAGAYQVFVGDSSEDRRLTGVAMLKGSRVKP